MMKSIFFTFVFSFSLIAQAVAMTPEEAMSKLQLTQDSGGVHGQFEQKKYFGVLTRALISRGLFSISENELVWRTEKPVPSAIIFDTQGLWLENHLGEKQLQPQATEFANLLFGILRADFEQLNRDFEFSDTEGSCIELSPSSELLSKALTNIQLCGVGRVSEVKLLDHKQNRTEIYLVYED